MASSDYFTEEHKKLDVQAVKFVDALKNLHNKTNEQHEIRYATNQTSPLKSEQKGEATLGHIIFKEGNLFVPKEKQNLQKLLSL